MKLKPLLSGWIMASILCLASACSPTTPKTSILDATSITYNNGTYCAEMHYNNPKTGKSSVYTLPIEVSNGRLITIYWTNGGWLDSSHFTPPDISNGSASFTTNDGKHYVVSIVGGREVCPQ